MSELSLYAWDRNIIYLIAGMVAFQETRRGTFALHVSSKYKYHSLAMPMKASSYSATQLKLN